MADRTLPIALIQHPCEEDVVANVQRCCAMIAQAAGEGAKLILTQELFASRYFPQTEDAARFALAEPGESMKPGTHGLEGSTAGMLSDLAAEHGVAISASLFERRAEGVYHNTSIVIGPDGVIIDRYRKMHIPDDPGFYEKYYFTPGDRGFRAPQVRWPGPDDGEDRIARLGTLICWDQWFPEAARLTAMKGAHLLAYPTAIGHCAGEDAAECTAQIESWRTVQRSHAIANGVYVAAINRVGVEGDLSFWGRSFVADPRGRIIAEAPADEAAILHATLDLQQVERARVGWPFLRDRRIDAYDGLLERLLDEAPD